MDKITVLYIIDNFAELAGAEKNLFDIATRLNPQRYKAIVMCFKGGELVDLLRSKGIEIIDLKLKKIYTLRALIKAIGIYKLIKQRNVKIVVTYHKGSDFLGGGIAKLAGVSAIISNRRDMGYNLRKRHFFIYKLINNVIFTKIIAVSDAVKNMIIEKQNASPEKIITIYNGVEMNRFFKKTDGVKLKEEFRIEPTAPVVGIIAGIRRIKGHRYFIEAAASVLKEMPDVRFLIVGHIWETEVLGDNPITLVKELGIDDSVIFTGKRSDIPEIFSLMNVSVLSSLSEGFSNAIIESMAAGKPVVATNVGGNREAIMNGETGLLVPPKDSNSLAEAILYLLKDKDLAQQMGLAGRKRVEDLFNIKRMIADIEAIYDVVFENKLEAKRASRKKLIRSKFLKLFKTIFAEIAYCLGLITLFHKLKSFNGIKILSYHKISDDYPDYLNLNAKVSSFEKQMQYLRKHYNIISLQEATNLLNVKSVIPEKTIVITFDDGYKCLYKNAFPILKKYRIPATIFLTVEPIEYGAPLWFEQIAYMFNKTPRRTVNLEPFGLRKYLLETLDEKKEAIYEIVSHAKKLNKKQKEVFIKFLSKELLVDPDDLRAKNNILSWEEIREMKKEGISFGVHTMTHSILTGIPFEEAEYEICQSKKIIEERLGEKAHFFAYPNGRWNDFNNDIINLLKNNQFSCACTLISGTNNTDLFALKRINIHEGITTNIFGLFYKPLFAAEVSGIFTHLFRRFLRKEVAV